MEGKRALAIVALCMLMLLSGPQQVAALSKFCICYKGCYNSCRTLLPRFICLPKCIIDCNPIKEKEAALTSAADCSKTCLISICGSAATDTSGATACVDDCTKNWSQYANHLSRQDWGIKQ